jgi:hypothetical protein
MSPEVWVDALPRIVAAAASAGLPMMRPNEDPLPRPVPPAPWLDVEAAAESAAPIELGGQIWEERGIIFLHILIPVGSGLMAGLVARKALSVAFRTVTDAIPGLYYNHDGHGFDPMGPPGDDGVYRDLTLIIRYRFQDISTA